MSTISITTKTEILLISITEYMWSTTWVQIKKNKQQNTNKIKYKSKQYMSTKREQSDYKTSTNILIFSLLLGKIMSTNENIESTKRGSKILLQQF